MLILYMKENFIYLYKWFLFENRDVCFFLSFSFVSFDGIYFGIIWEWNLDMNRLVMFYVCIGIFRNVDVKFCWIW